MKRLIILLTTGLIAFGISCTDLEEEVLDEALGRDILEAEGEQIAEGLLNPVYGRLEDLFNEWSKIYAMQSVTTYEAIVPYRGGRDWYDGGKYIEFHRHTWNSEHSKIRDVFQGLTQGSSRALLAINEITKRKPQSSATYIAEAHAMHAFFSAYLLDFYGVAMKKDPADFGNPDISSEVLRGKDAFDYIIATLDKAEPDLLSISQVGSGRFSKEAVKALKARLYLNRAVYEDPYAPTHTFEDSDMDQVIANCDPLINSTYFALETEDYFKIFNVDNHNHPELIFAGDARKEANGSSRFSYAVLGRAQVPSANWAFRNNDGTNAVSCCMEFYDLWEGNHDDQRFYKEYLPQKDTVIAPEDYTLNRGILRGQQWGIVSNEDGTDYKKDENGNLILEPLTEEREGVPLNFTYQVDLDGGVGSRQEAGYRPNKYEFDGEVSSKSDGRVDYPLLRLGDVYLMKAEALFRKGLSNEAINVINELRNARDANPITSLTLERMFMEREFEMYVEQISRTDFIRFGKYEDSWTSKDNSEIHRRLFPIPKNVVDANPELWEQNDGY